MLRGLATASEERPNVLLLVIMRRTSNATLLPLDTFQVRRHVRRHDINPEMRQLLLVSGRLRARRRPSACAGRRSRQAGGLRRDRGRLCCLASR